MSAEQERRLAGSTHAALVFGKDLGLPPHPGLWVAVAGRGPWLKGSTRCLRHEHAASCRREPMSKKTPNHPHAAEVHDPGPARRLDESDHLGHAASPLALPAGRVRDHFPHHTVHRRLLNTLTPSEH